MAYICIGSPGLYYFATLAVRPPHGGECLQPFIYARDLFDLSNFIRFDWELGGLQVEGSGLDRLVSRGAGLVEDEKNENM